MPLSVRPVRTIVPFGEGCRGSHSKAAQKFWAVCGGFCAKREKMSTGYYASDGLDINLLWTVVNVLVMYAVLRKFLFKPVQDVIAKRQQMVDANLADAETSKKEAAETMNAAQEKLRNVDNEAAARREAYEKQAEVEKQQLLADARKQADAIVAAGKASAEAERQSKLREADAQTTALARAMCEKLLARNLTAQDDARLLDDLLEKAGAGNGN